MLTFRWTCSYQGSLWFDVCDDTGRYEAELRQSAPDYALAAANGDDVRREMLTSVGILHRSHAVKDAGGELTHELPCATVAAFNAWRLAEHARWLGELRAQPHRYGVISDDDALARAPMLAKCGRYVWGENRWVVTHGRDGCAPVLP